MATPQQQQAPPQQQQVQAPWPLYDLFLDVPHPAASPHSPPSYIIGTPTSGTATDNHDSIEQELSKSMPQIARFAFPEFDQDANPPPPPPDQAPPVNRFDQYAMQPPAFQMYTFSLTLQSGMRVHGHVRRYLPCHIGGKTRYDVGRRGERALVILTRVTGADMIYSAILKSIDAISSHQLASPHHFKEDQQPQQTFLHNLFHKHQKLARVYVSKPSEARNKPVFLTLQDLEVGRQDGGKKFSMVDSTHFLLSPPLLIPRTTSPFGDLVNNTSNTSILPVLRCLGVAHTLRLLCALLSERRIILISASPTRLATCCKAAIAMLAQGLLQWQHLYIPVLPPHLWQYLAAPYPYLIGILASLTPRLDRTDGLGEVLIINLDQNQMETRGIPTDKIQQRIPDLLRNMSGAGDFTQQFTGAVAGAAPASSPELLAQDLVELMKNDKRTLNGESALASMQDTAVKATKAVKATFFKLKERSQKFFTQQSGSYSENDVKDDAASQELDAAGEPLEVNPMAPDFIYTEGCRNEMGEEEARLAFVTFFVSMVGNMRWYLSAQPGQQPQLDRKRFLQQKRASGEGEHSTMWPLLQNFCQTQMLEEFAKLRVEEMRVRQPVTADSPLFLQCSNYHHQHKVDFTLLSVRRVSRQVLQTNPSRMLQQTNARRMAMELTSKRTFEGDYNKALADLVEQCRECSSVLFDVMSVVWIRMRDNRGLQWRHAVLSLHILKNLLFHGPLAAVAETTDGLDKIRALKYYNGNRQTTICVQIRQAAAQVYSLVVDRSKLFHIRRVCISKRRSLKKQDLGRLRRDTRLLKGISIPFQKVHAAMHPNAPRSNAPRTPPPSAGAPPASTYSATPTFAVLPPAQTPQTASQPPPPAQVAQSTPQAARPDWLGLEEPVPVQATPAPAPPPAATTTDVFGMFAETPTAVPSTPAPAPATSDVLGLFGDMTLGGGAAAPTPQYTPQHDPFAGAIVAQTPQQPQQYQYPPQQQQHQQQQQVRAHSPVPVRGQSLSPVPPQFGHQQQTPQNPYGAGHAPVQSQQQRALSRTPPSSRGVSPPPPANRGYGQAPPAYATPAGYQTPGQVPAFAQPPAETIPAFASPPPQQTPGYGGHISPHPQQQQQQGYHPNQAPYGYQGQQQQQQQQQYGAYPPAGGQAPPPQQGPFF